MAACKDSPLIAAISIWINILGTFSFATHESGDVEKSGVSLGKVSSGHFLVHHHRELRLADTWVALRLGSARSTRDTIPPAIWYSDRQKNALLAVSHKFDWLWCRADFCARYQWSGYTYGTICQSDVGYERQGLALGAS